MSIWMHVNGSIRVDAIGAMGIFSASKFEEILGKQIDFNDDDWETTLPCGSEGSLSWSVTTNSHEDNLAAHVVAIYGDLRNYSDVAAIRTWFADVCAKLGIVRSAILEVEVEGMELVVLRHNKALGDLDGTGGIEEVYNKNG